RVSFTAGIQSCRQGRAVDVAGVDAAHPGRNTAIYSGSAQYDGGGAGLSAAVPPRSAELLTLWWGGPVRRRGPAVDRRVHSISPNLKHFDGWRLSIGINLEFRERRVMGGIDFLPQWTVSALSFHAIRQ